MTIDPFGLFLYSANFGSNDVISFNADNSTGTLSFNGTFPAGNNPTSITMGRSGLFVYVANFGSNDVSVFSITETSGDLTLVETVAAGTDPRSITTTGTIQ